MMQPRNRVVPGVVLLFSLLCSAQALAQQNPRLVTAGAAPTAVAKPPAAAAVRQPAMAVRQPAAAAAPVVPAAPVISATQAAAPQPAQPLPVAASTPAQPAASASIASEPASIVMPVQPVETSAGGQGVSAWWVTTPIGDDTRALLAAQAQGAQAGAPLPTLGETATAAWRRYLKSFEHPLPEWFGEKVEVGM